MERKEIFINGLSRYMERMHFSQQDVADVIGRSVQNVSQLLKGKNGITYDNLIKLFEKGMRLEEAFGEEVAAIIRSGEQDAVVDGERLSPDQIVLEGLRFLREKNPAELESLLRGSK